MTNDLPELLYEDLLPTRDYLQDVCLILSALQRAYIPKQPHQWEYGLSINLRGIITLPLKIQGKTVLASIDFVRNKMRVGTTSWAFDEYTPPELLNNLKAWLSQHDQQIKLDVELKHKIYRFAPIESKKYAQSLWWMYHQFHTLKEANDSGETSPILLYPDHFDLALSWFPFEDDRQLTIGYSTGDDTIAEPYLYITIYPHNDTFSKQPVPQPILLQTKDFEGYILRYADLASAMSFTDQFKTYAKLFNTGAALLRS